MACLAPERAVAQWSSRPAVVPLPPAAERWGVKTGAFRIWPRLGVEGRYDSNFFREHSSEGPVSVGSLRVVPGVTLVNPKPRLFRLYLDLMGDVRIYFGDDDSVTGHTNAGATASLEVEFFPRSVVGFRIFDRFHRDLEARSYETDENLNRNDNLAGLQVLFRPGGRALQIGLEYAFGMQLHDTFKAGDNFYHDFGMEIVWKFYPLTSAFLEVDFKMIDYASASADTDGHVPNIESMPLRAIIGLNGYITKRLGLLVQAGWAHGFYGRGASFSGPIGMARVSYHITPSTLFQVGYGRDYENSLWGNYWAEHRAFLSVQQQFLDRRVDLQLNASYHYRDFARFDPASTLGEPSQKVRTEHEIKVGVGAHFAVARWLDLSVGYSYSSIMSPFEISATTDAGTSVDKSSYHRHQVYGGVVGRY